MVMLMGRLSLKKLVQPIPIEISAENIVGQKKEKRESNSSFLIFSIRSLYKNFSQFRNY